MIEREIYFILISIMMGIGGLTVLWVMWMDYQLYKARKGYLLRQEKSEGDKNGIK